MKIVVCVKQVPDTHQVKIDPVKGTLIRDGVPSILNPDDANALEAALEIKDNFPDTKVIVLTMGPPQAKFVLKECLAMGADEAILLSDRRFGGADTWATSNTIASAIRKISNVDIVFAGRQAIDGDTAQVGPQIAQRLGIPQVTYVQGIDISGKLLTVKRQLDIGYEVVLVETPCLLTAIKELNTPRYMTIQNIMKASEIEILTYNCDDLGLCENECGLNASPTQVFKSFTPPPKDPGEMLQGSEEEMVQELMFKLKSKHVI